MKIFVTGASGFVGRAVVQELKRAGHQVLGLARSDASAAAVSAAGAEVHRGALDDHESLRAGAAAADGVIHTAFVHDDFAAMAAAGVTDAKAIAAIGDALAGSNRPFVVTSAIGALAPGRLATEDDVADPTSPGSHRAASDRVTLELASRGVRATLIRLPPSVHGDGDYAFVPALVRIAREKGVSAYLGDGSSRWPAVHQLDAATLYRLALEQGVAGARYHAVAEEGVPTRDIAEVIGRKLGVPVVAKPLDQAAEHFTWLGRFLALDVPSSSKHTREQLGWSPHQRGLLADLDHGTYFGAP